MVSIPAFNAFSATNFPTAAATSTLVPFPISFSLEDAAKIVTPFTSSIS